MEYEENYKQSPGLSRGLVSCVRVVWISDMLISSSYRMTLVIVVKWIVDSNRYFESGSSSACPDGR
jgi:hypothetical protein